MKQVFVVTGAIVWFVVLLGAALWTVGMISIEHQKTDQEDREDV